MGVALGNDVMEGVKVGGTFVSVGAVVAEGGTAVSVCTKVEVAGGVRLGVAVLKLGMVVTPGVLVGTLGTYNFCPT